VAAAANLLMTRYAADVIVMELLPEPDEAWTY
jgi:hypothetical protein